MNFLRRESSLLRRSGVILLCCIFPPKMWKPSGRELLKPGRKSCNPYKTNSGATATGKSMTRLDIVGDLPSMFGMCHLRKLPGPHGYYSAANDEVGNLICVM